jgi:putative transcriptional regulator
MNSESYEIPDNVMTPQKISEIRKRVASSTKVFERDFMIPARTMENYEQGRRKPDTATVALLRIIERAPDVARDALSGDRG